MPSPFKNPELMIIGDSLAQGCRSLSVTPNFCAESYGAIIAREQGWEFNVPAFPRAVLFDLEEIIFKYLNWGFLISWPILFRRIQKNLDEWTDHFLSPGGDFPEWCDNLAVAGATLEDIGADPDPARHFSWNRSRAIVEQHQGASLKDLVLGQKDALATMHLGINSGFLLNPCGLKKYAHWTVLDWVRARRPKRLIVHMGHNNGLYPIGSNAVFTDLRQTALPAYKKMISAVMEVTNIKQQVIFILLPKVSAAANLEVIGDERDAKGYGPRYRPVFSTSGNEFNATQMKKVDDMVVEVNRALRDHIRSFDATNWSEVVEAYEILEANDYKQTLSLERQSYLGKYTINNRYLRGEGKQITSGGPAHATPVGVKWAFADGGFQSVDGMHPSAIGYGEVAVEIAKRLNFSYDKARIRKAALAAEKMVTHYPGGHQSVVSAMKFLRGKPKGGVAPEPAVDESDKHNQFIHTALAAQRACGRC